MSKRVTSGLTGSRKKRTTPKKRQPEPPDIAGAKAAYDRAIDFLGRIHTLAELLEVTGIKRDAEDLNAAMVSEAGSMIRDEAERLRDVLETIHRKSLTHAAHP